MPVCGPTITMKKVKYPTSSYFAVIMAARIANWGPGEKIDTNGFTAIINVISIEL